MKGMGRGQGFTESNTYIIFHILTSLKLMCILQVMGLYLMK